MKLRKWLVYCSVAVLILTGTAAATPAPTQTDTTVDGEVIDECTTITEPGTYVLENDLTAEGRDFCIIVEDTHDVLLDAQGRAVDGHLRSTILVIHSHNVTVRNVVSTASSNFGIWVERSRHVILENNTIHHFENQSVDLARRAIFISNSETLRVQQNRIEGIGLRNESGQDNGVSIHHSRHITVTGNHVFGTASAISSVNSSNIRIQENILERNVYGIQMRRYSHDIVAEQNEIRNHGLCPMDVKNSSDILINNNRMTNHAGLALAINATNVTISNNILKNSSSFGIVVATDSSQVDILNNTVTNSSSYAGVGVFGRVSDVRIDKNTIAGNSPHGILLEQDVFRVSIRNNSISGNAENGVTIRPRVNDILISKNRILNNGERAIANEVPDGVTIEDNSINGDAEDRVTSGKTNAETSENRVASTETEVLEEEGQSATTTSPGQVGFGLTVTVMALSLFSILRLQSRVSW